MSAQPQQIQQPPVVYPTTATKPTQDTSSSTPPHSDGSFGTAFIVLAVILVVSALACVLGRVCSRKSSKQQPKAAPKQNKKTLPKEREPRELRDVEFGFDRKRMPRVKPHDGDIELGFDRNRPPSVKHGVKFKLPEDGRKQRDGGRDMAFEAGS